MDEYIEFEKKDKLGVIKMNNPPVNSLSIPLMEQLNDRLRQIEGDQEIRVVIITGVGKFFAAGGDIQELEKVNTSSEGLQLSIRIQSIFNRIEDSSKPIIAAINGHCLGGGLELALACHIRVADEGASLGVPEINLAVIPGGGGTQRLPQVVGRSKAYEMILSGDAVDAKEAYLMGLVNFVCPKGACMGYSERYASKFLQKAPSAITAAVQAIQASGKGERESGLRKEAQLFGHLCETLEKKEGMKVFLEKRKLNF